MLDNTFIWIRAGLIFQAPTFLFFQQSFYWTDLSKPFLNNHAAQKQKLNWKWNTPGTSATSENETLRQWQKDRTF